MSEPSARRDLRLPRALRRRPREHHRREGHQGQRHPHRRRPARRRERATTGQAIAERYELDLTVVNPDGRPGLGLHDARLGRQDPHGPVEPLGHGVGARAQRRLRHPHRQRRRRRPARHRHARRRPDEPQPLPRRRDRLPVPHAHRSGGRMRRSARPSSRRRSSTGSPSRSAAACGRCRSASSGSCPGSSTARSASAARRAPARSFLRFDGSVWTTDKDGILLALLASEILAVTGKTPSQLYRELTEQFGDPVYERVDAPASPAQKAALGKLDGDAITATELAGEPITAKLSRAPGNDAAARRRQGRDRRRRGSRRARAAPRTSTRSTPSRSTARTTCARCRRRPSGSSGDALSGRLIDRAAGAAQWYSVPPAHAEELLERRHAGGVQLASASGDADVPEVPRLEREAGDRDLVGRVPQQEPEAPGVGGEPAALRRLAEAGVERAAARAPR